MFTLFLKWVSGCECWLIIGMFVLVLNFVLFEKDSGDVVEMFKNVMKVVKASASVSATFAASSIKVD